VSPVNIEVELVLADVVVVELDVIVLADFVVELEIGVLIDVVFIPTLQLYALLHDEALKDTVIIIVRNNTIEKTVTSAIIVFLCLLKDILLLSPFDKSSGYTFVIFCVYEIK
jgi:hypothetical protein